MDKEETNRAGGGYLCDNPTGRHRTLLRDNPVCYQVRDLNGERETPTVEVTIPNPVHRTDPNNPSIAFVASNNLALGGLSKQGGLNVDVPDHNACNKLQQRFDDQWNDRWCIDISNELAEIIDTSWAREGPVRPYYIYLKILYHLSM